MTLLVLYNRFMENERENIEKEEKEEKEVCPVCLRSIGNVDCYVTKCGHKFHGSCMLKWCEIRRDTDKEEACPMCRGQLKNSINFPGVTKKLVHDFLRILGSHDAPRNAIGEELLWMQLSVGCQQDLIEALEYHYFINEEAMYLGTERETQRERRRMPYSFSLSDLDYHF